MRRGIGVVFALGVFLVIGCGGEAPSFAKDKVAKSADRRSATREARGPDELAGGEVRQDGAAPPKTPPLPPPPKVEAEQKPQRKIIYTGTISLVVEDFGKAETTLQGMIADHDGYVANSDVSSEPNAPRHGNWTIRIPVAKADDFRLVVIRLGEPRRNTLDSRDITDQYHDLRAEMLNLEARETALRELYKKQIANSKLSELLEVDREISSVRGQINVRKGQLQRWDKETEFTTFTLSMYDRRGYVPPESPDYTTTLERTFSSSLNAMLEMGKRLGIVIVAVAPWLVLLAFLAVPLYFVVLRKRQPPPVPVAQTAEPRSA